MSSYRL
jgi:hypothetical protein